MLNSINGLMIIAGSGMAEWPILHHLRNNISDPDYRSDRRLAEIPWTKNQKNISGHLWRVFRFERRGINEEFSAHADRNILLNGLDRKIQRYLARRECFASAG
jgi:hypothetical protein